MAVIFLLPSMESILQQIMSPSPCCLAACIMSNEVLSKAPSIFSIASREILLSFTASSMCVCDQMEQCCFSGRMEGQYMLIYSIHLIFHMHSHGAFSQ
jgi:hypothetical protein